MACCNKQGRPHRRDGPWAWLVCFTSFMNLGMCFAFMQTYGIFLPVLGEYFEESRAKTALVGSLAISMAFVTGPLFVKLSHWFGRRPVALFSGIGCVIATLASSFVTNLTQMYFSFGIFYGLSAGGILNTNCIIISVYFKKWFSLASGIVASGGGALLMTLPPVTQILLNAVGWRNALRVIAGMMLVLWFLLFTYDPNVEEDSDTIIDVEAERDENCQTSSPLRRKTRAIDCSVWNNPVYSVTAISFVVTFAGLYVPALHLVKFAKDLHISSTKASQLFIYIGICSTTSRIVVGQILNKKWLSPRLAFQIGSLLAGLSIMLVTLASNYVHLVVFSVAFGTAHGTLIVSQFVFYFTCFDDVSKGSIAFTWGVMVSSVAVMGGAPLAGFIADQTGSYVPSFYVIGGMVIVAALLPFTLDCCKCGQPLNKKDDTEMDIITQDRMQIIGSRLANASAGSILHKSAFVSDHSYSGIGYE